MIENALDQSSTVTIRVQSHARLHFGLLEINPSEPNCYGGIGLMLQHPSSALVAEPRFTNSVSDVLIHATRYWQQRIEASIRQWLSLSGVDQIPVGQISLHDPPLAHCGLGSGTQIACSVITLLTASNQYLMSGSTNASPHQVTAVDFWDRVASEGIANQALEVLALKSGRGKRSFVGLCGFLHGGAVIDRGQSANVDPPSDRTQSLIFPPDWRIVLLQDQSYVGESGHRESSLFERCAQHPNRNKQMMLDLIDNVFIPSVSAKDWDECSRCVGLYGEMAGELFQPVQGGVYRSPTIGNRIKLLKSWGLQGVGQSSWGPTVFAMTRDSDHATWLLNRTASQMPEVSCRSIESASSYGATIHTSFS